jgi:predicted nucleotidyltransferase
LLPAFVFHGIIVVSLTCTGYHLGTLLCMIKKEENTFFTKDIYENEIALEVNADVLERIYNSKISPETTLPIEFFFISNTKKNLRILESIYYQLIPITLTLKWHHTRMDLNY